MPHSITADIVIMGSGPGGSALAYALMDSGADVLVVERGGHLPKEKENWDPVAVLGEGRYKTKERWRDLVNNRDYRPGNHYWVGGQTKMYGANLQRFRNEDFKELQHQDGLSPAWPISYDDLEVYYAEAERIYGLRGEAGIDPTEPDRSTPFPYPPIPHEPAIASLIANLEQQGLHPHPLEMALHWEGKSCNSEFPCTGCDGLPCFALGKADAETQCMQPALKSPNVRLLTHTFIEKLRCSSNGERIESVRAVQKGEEIEIKGSTFILACGAANSPAVLLRSSSRSWSSGIGNEHGRVGRNYMLQNQSALMAVRPIKKTSLTMQKTIGLHDFLFSAPDFPYPAGALQTLGKLTGTIIQTDQANVPRKVLDSMAERSIDWWSTSEELPNPENRVQIKPDGRLAVTWRPNNEEAHRVLIREAKKMMRAAGFPVVLHKRFGIEANAHQCGTLKMGTDPRDSVCDADLKVHGVHNLFISDASVFPSSTAMAPTLTITALSLRLAKHLISLQ